MPRLATPTPSMLRLDLGADAIAPSPYPPDGSLVSTCGEGRVAQKAGSPNGGMTPRSAPSGLGDLAVVVGDEQPNHQRVCWVGLLSLAQPIREERPTGARFSREKTSDARALAMQESIRSTEEQLPHLRSSRHTACAITGGRHTACACYGGREAVSRPHYGACSSSSAEKDTCVHFGFFGADPGCFGAPPR